ncbi:MAG: nucleotidyltransferase family protein [Gammaproteobacteria bacterium]|nr:nucleotidyltransferase family protein [Gammaproteobacteria bacterium]
MPTGRAWVVAVARDAYSALACDALCARQPRWTLPRDAATTDGFLRFADYHGIDLCVLAALDDTPAWPSWPRQVRAALRQRLHGQVAVELARGSELVRVADAFAADAVDALLLKGAALARTVYTHPAHRTRSDTDVLVAAADRARAFAALTRLGYRRPPVVHGRYVSSQATFVLPGAPAVHAIDLHWQISNAQVFARQFRFAELWADARPIAGLPAGIRVLSPEHAALHACLHRAAHVKYDEQDRLQWLLDLHLLGQSMDAAAWSRFAALAERKGMARVCLSAVAATAERLATRVPAVALQALSRAAGRAELSADLLRGGRLAALMSDYRALPDWRARATLLREHLLPPADYMRERFAASGALPLGLAYLRRLWRAPGRLVTRPGRPR